MSLSIKIENISKQYRLGIVGTGTLRHDFRRWWHVIRGEEDPYLKIGEVNDRSTKGASDYVWALKDINFEVEQGDVLGIIGKNGAGKSTLLKILSKVTAPTTGSITYKGKIGSLLEVGTGFNTELTGRENIFLNGAILGMRKNEILRNFDAIVDFSGCERYIDTPVKRYSSGMMVRLGFAVAAFLEPEILVVDEVLAVGDAEFQRKAMGKMQDVSRNDGRTVLFVSHNMGAVKDLCRRGVLLEMGKVDFCGPIKETIERYLSRNILIDSSKWIRNIELPNEIGFEYVDIRDKNDVITDTIGSEEDFAINIHIHSRIQSNSTIVAVQINDLYGNPVLTTSNSDYKNSIESMEPGRTIFSVKISKNILMPGTYYLTIACFESGRKLYDIIDNELSIRIEDMGLRLHNKDSKGMVYQVYEWIKE